MAFVGRATLAFFDMLVLVALTVLVVVAVDVLLFIELSLLKLDGELGGVILAKGFGTGLDAARGFGTTEVVVVTTLALRGLLTLCCAC